MKLRNSSSWPRGDEVNSFLSYQVLLGVRPGMRISLINAPPSFLNALGELPQSVSVLDSCPTGLDVIFFFSNKKHELVERLPKLAQTMALTGCIWVLFPPSPGAPSGPNDGLVEDFIRFAALEMGLVDNKRILLDTHWTALRLVWQKKSPKPEKPSHFPTFQA